MTPSGEWRLGVWGQNSFLVHGFFTVAAIISGLIFQISLWEWLIVGSVW